MLDIRGIAVCLVSLFTHYDSDLLPSRCFNSSSCQCRDLTRQSAVLSAISVAPILQVSTASADVLSVYTSIDTVTIHENGVPIIKTSADEVFAYHLEMRTWTRIADIWLSSSEFYGSGGKGPLAYWERSVLTGGSSTGKNAGAFAKGLLKGDPKAQRILSMDHVEVFFLSLWLNRLVFAVVLLIHSITICAE